MEFVGRIHVATVSQPGRPSKAKHRVLAVNSQRLYVTFVSNICLICNLPRAEKPQTKLLVAAEKLFAEFGYHGVSLRQITQAAEVNLAAVNYHHGDKESLYREVITQRLRQLAAVRRTKLADAEMRVGGGLIPLGELADILAATLLPAAPADRPRARLIGRIMIDPLPFTADVLATEFQPTMTQWGQAVRRHLPGLAPADFIWRLSFVVGALHHAAASLHDMRARTSGICGNDDGVTAHRSFCAFAVSAFATNGFPT